MLPESSTNSTTMASSDHQVLPSSTPETMTNLAEQERLLAQSQWDRAPERAKMQDFLSHPSEYITQFWQQYKSIFISLLLIATTLFAVKAIFSIISFTTHLLFLGSIFELIGVSYSAWFVYRYLLKAETRQELAKKIEEIKQAIIGTTEEIVGNTSIDVKKSVVIQKSPEELYKFWRNFENLPRFMNHLKSVQVIDEKRSHWVAKAPLDTSVEWDAEIIDERENKSIVWRSLEGADVDSIGSVAFVSANGSGTEVKVTMKYNPPAGVVGVAAATLFGENPQQQLDEDLVRFKRVMETLAVH